MKKLLSFIIVCLLVILPTNASALSAKSVSVSGPSEVKQGEEFELSIDVSLDTLDPEGTIMFFATKIDIEYDTATLVITGANASNFETDAFEDEKGKRFIYSSYDIKNIDNISEETNCTNNILCNRFNTKLKFFAKGSGNTTFNVTGITAYYMDLKGIIEDENSEIKKEDIIESSKAITGSKTINIISTEPPKNIPIENKKNDNLQFTLPALSREDIEQKVKKETPKDTSSNNSLKSLSIDNYPIEFDTHKLKYNINVPEGVNSVKVNAVADDDTAKIKVIGANDLAKNNYVITVEVTAQNGSKKSYVITTRGETEPKSEEVTTTEAKEEKTRDDEAIKEDQEKRKKINKKLISYVIIGVVTILLLVIANAIINKIRYRKLDKMLKKF